MLVSDTLFIFVISFLLIIILDPVGVEDTMLTSSSVEDIRQAEDEVVNDVNDSDDAILL